MIELIYRKYDLDRAMHQLSFTDMEFELRRKTRKTRTEHVTERLDELVPWGDLLDLIRPFYFESGHRGAPAVRS